MPSAVLRPGLRRCRPDEIPEGWQAVRLGEVARTVGGGRLGLTKERDYRPTGYPAFSAAGQDGFVTVAEHRNTAAVVLSAIGARAGRCFEARGDWTTLANTQVIIPDGPLLPAYLCYRANQEGYWPRSGSAQPFIRPSDIGRCWILLPPLPEQRRIVATLAAADSLSAASDRTIAKLTRVEHGILEDLLTRAPLPRDWRVAPLGELAEITYGIGDAIEPARTSGVPTITLPCVTASGDLDLSPALLAWTDPEKVPESRCLRPGDLLFNWRNGSRRHLGKTALFDAPGRFTHVGFLLRVRCDPAACDPRFVRLALRRLKRRGFFHRAKSQVNGTFNSTELAALRLPVPPPAEQVRIADNLALLQSRIDAERAAVAKQRALVRRLRRDLLSGRVRTRT